MITPDIIKDFVIASHFNLQKVKDYLAQYPDLLTAQHQWGDDDFEDGLGAASHVGNREIAQFFISQGVEPTICTLAMLGDKAGIQAFLEIDPTTANARGAHGISVMFHAALSGDVSIASLLKRAGCTGDYNHALHAAVMKSHADMTRWLLDNGVTDVNSKNFQGKTALAVAIENGDAQIEAMLREKGGVA
ncbi:MAG: ankyrin repeat domain-containing protein [Anaerolineae bacterium]|jgi:ankyrin repeat protein|nr:ankyrin repeat domain-containing protein [Anaerolineae bacterium]